jgi:helicase
MVDVPALIQQANGFAQFNPMQTKVLQTHWQKQNLVVASPTASGKTIIAELTGLESILNRGKKAIYTCPLRALAGEHFRDLKEKYGDSQKIKMAVSTGDLDSSSKYLSNFDFIFCTYEKLDSLIIHRSEWLNQIGVLIIDEVHELDSDRGATLEMVITKLRMLNPKLQIVALSATIPNADELAVWLKAELVESDYRPVPLKEGVHYHQTLEFRGEEKGREFDKEDPIEALLEDTLKLKKQALVFANTRKRAESLAKQSSGVIFSKLTPEEKKSLEKIATKIENALESPTEQCKKLASFVRSGVAFHHAGLVQRQREVVEDNFRGGLLKVISSTPTLAAGINLPAFRVIITSLQRYDFGGMVSIPVREYFQMAGRAGRPRYDSAGESIVLCKTDMEAEDVMRNYILGEMEEIRSKLGVEPVLRMHLLALIASRFVFDVETMDDFFSRTLYAHQYKDLDTLKRMLRALVKELGELELIEGEDNRFWCTKIGQRVAELYLDPLSADALIKKIKRKDLTVFGSLFAITDTTEFRPYLSVSRKIEAEKWEELQSNITQLPLDSPDLVFSDGQILEKFQTTQFLDAWIGEMGEQELLEKFNIAPGIIRTKLLNADWLVYGMVELAPLVGAQPHVGMLSKLRKRLKSGIKEELILLCELRGIGRVRARRLYNVGIKNVSDVKNTSVENLSKVIGVGPAMHVKKQLGTEMEKGTKKKIEAQLKEQKTLFDVN